MCAGSKSSDLHTVDVLRKWDGRIKYRWRRLEARLLGLQRSSNPILHSTSWVPSGIVPELNATVADVLHLHWINAGFLSVEDIGHLTKPLVWTLHDMWPFCGAEHYGDDGPDARWRVGYDTSNRPERHEGLDIDRWVWKRKHRAWHTPIHIVAPSRWLAACARESALMRNWPVSVIPYALDLQQFQPWPKTVARQVLGLPQDMRLVLFGAIGGGKDPRKGWNLLQPALAGIATQMPDVAGVIFGQSEPPDPPRLGLPLYWMGRLNDDATLALLYSAADVMVVPSRQENLPQTGTEAQACGCPVVAFNCTGLPDVVEHGLTGYLAKPYDSDDLAIGIHWVLEDEERRNALGGAARNRAVRLWAPDVVGPQYLAVYETACRSGVKI
jgi:glycosyltransferase involved in cell wall biosynthesis